MLISSQKPFGISFSQDEMNTIQVVGTQTAVYQDAYTQRRDFIGIVEAKQSSRTGFELSGLLSAVYVDEGDYVKKGERLAELDTVRLEARRREAAAALKRAEADAELTESTFQRFSEARAVNGISAQERDEAEGAHNSARAAVDLAKAQLESIEVDIEKSTMPAPFDAVVVERLRDEGTVVEAGEAILQLQESGSLEVRVGVTRSLADSLEVGQEQRLLDSGSEVKGTVKRILPIRADNRAVELILTLDDEGSVRVGDILRLQLKENRAARGFWLPLSALREGQRGLWSAFVVAADTKAERRTLEVVTLQDAQAFVNGTVDDGEQVIVDGAHKIVPGQMVRVKNEHPEN